MDNLTNDLKQGRNAKTSIKMDSNYCQVVAMTDEEKRVMYSKLTKKELVRIIIERERVMQTILPATPIVYFNGKSPFEPPFEIGDFIKNTNSGCKTQSSPNISEQ